MTKLSLGYDLARERQMVNYDDFILNHLGIEHVTITTIFDDPHFTGNEIPSFENILRFIPCVTSLKFIYGQITFESQDMEIYRLWRIVKNFCKPTNEKYGNITELMLKVNFRDYVVQIVDFLGELCPNLEIFKLKKVDKVEIGSASLKTVVEHILEKMRNLTLFQLFVDDAVWVEEEWDEIVKIVPENLRYILVRLS